jgi:hypothetical protein
MFVTFFLVGAWHGQTSSFLFYGVLQGLGVSVNSLYQTSMTRRLGKTEYRKLRERIFYRSVSRGLTFTWFSFTLLWFWSDWSDLLERGAQLGPTLSVLIWPALLVVSTLLLSIWVVIFDRSVAASKSWGHFLISRYTRTMFATAIVLVTVSASMLLNSASPPIVYKNF